MIVRKFTFDYDRRKTNEKIFASKLKEIILAAVGGTVETAGNYVANSF